MEFSDTAWDFTEFYIAAHLPVSSLYSHADFTAFGEKSLAPLGIHYFPPFVRPAVFALVLKPLALLPYWVAYWFWAAFGLAGYFVTLRIVFRWLALPSSLLPAFALFMPSMFGIVTGQDSNVYLLVLTCALLFLARGQQLAAGVLLALCTYKFNLLIFLPLVLCLHKQWRALATFAIGAVSVAVISAALVSPYNYLALLRSIPAVTIGFVPGGIRGVVIRLGHADWYYPAALAGAIFCVYLISKLPLVEAFCVSITGALLLSFHGTWYDCALLVIPIVVAWRTARPVTRKLLLALIILPFAWIFGKEVIQTIAEVLILAHFTSIANALGPKLEHL